MKQCPKCKTTYFKEAPPICHCGFSLSGECQRSAAAPVKRSAADIKKAGHLACMAYNLMEVAQFLLKAADAAPAEAQQAESEAKPDKASEAQARNDQAHPRRK